MPNLARPPAPPEVSVLRLGAEPGPRDLLDRLRGLRRGRPLLPELAPADYARTHAAFELLSDQRDLITAHLDDRFSHRSAGPVSVLSVGCGDGTLDAPLAAALADARPSRPVRYVGVDPFPGSATAFGAALRDLERDTLTPEVHTATFEAAPLTGHYDVVTFVHSMYYVRDVAQTLAAAYALLRPGGELLVLTAPRAELNALVEVLAPPLEGHEQWFSDDVEKGLHRAGLAIDSASTLQAGFDARAASDEVLDFAVQARLTPELRPLVRDYLDAVALPAACSASGWRVPHPVDVHRVVRPA